MKRQSGFTLIEVVTAFVLLALVLSTSFQVFSTGLTRTGDLEDYSRALAIAQSQLALGSEGDSLQEGQASGESADRRFRWTLEVSRFDAQAQDPSQAQAQPQPTPGAALLPPYILYRVAVRVAWHNAAARELTLDLATLTVGRRV